MSEGRTVVYVGGLDAAVTEAMLRLAFIPFGELLDVHVPLEPKTGQCRGFGFVEYSCSEDAADAIDNMHDSEILGRRIRVNLARTPAKRARKAIWADEDMDKLVEEYGGFSQPDDAEKRPDDAFGPQMDKR